MYQHLSSMVNPASMMTTFCVQFRRIAAASNSGVSPYIRWKSRIRRRLRGEKPSAAGEVACRYSDAATAAPFSLLPLTSRPISQYISICGSCAAISVSSVVNMAV